METEYLEKKSKPLSIKTLKQGRKTGVGSRSYIPRSNNRDLEFLVLGEINAKRIIDFKYSTKKQKNVAINYLKNGPTVSSQIILDGIIKFLSRNYREF
jgi:hypothetical protein